MSVNIAIIGYGRMGANLANTFAQTPGCHIASICDPRPDLKEAVSNHSYAKAALVKDYHEVLRDPTIDAVVIATLPQQHFELAEAALQAGKHVFVEKPITQTVEEARKLQALAREKDRRLEVDHVLFYEQAARWMQENLEHLGAPKHYVHRRVHELLPERSRHCCIESHSPHALYMVDMLDNYRSNKITVRAKTTDRTRHFEAQLAFSSGLTAEIRMAKEAMESKAGETRYTHVDFDNGNHVVWEERVNSHRGEALSAVIDGKGYTPDIAHDMLPLDTVANDFIDAIKEHRQPLADASRAIRVQQIMDAIYRSVETGQDVSVDLDPVEKLPSRSKNDRPPLAARYHPTVRPNAPLTR